MITNPSCSLYLHYRIKEGKETELLALIEGILDACAKEDDFITGVLHRTPDRPNEFTLFELWKGTKEHFFATQGTREYRKSYISASKLLIEEVAVTWDTPIRVWGEFGPLR